MKFKKWLLINEAKKSSDIAKELLGNDESLFKKIKSIIPINIPEKLQGQLLPIAAFYYKQEEPQIVILKDYLEDYANLIILNKMPIITVNDDLTVDGDFKSFIHWTQIIDSKKDEDKVLNAPLQGDVEDQQMIAHSPDNKIKVYLANSANQCIILGKGESFCISRPDPSNMFQTYRDTKTSTFYFIYDNTRNDDLAIVVIDVTQHGIELTDRKNQTAQTMQDPYLTIEKRIDSNPELYLKYLKEKGIDTTIFKNISKSPEEKEEHEKLGQTNYNLEWFKSLTLEEKSKYIGRGHELSNNQFDYIYSNNFITLLKQYVRIGVKVENYQLNKIASKRELKDIYLHNRLIADKHNNNLSKEEFDLLNPKQQEEFYNVSNKEKIYKALQIENFSLVKELIEQGESVPYYALDKAIKINRLDLVKYFVKHGVILGESNSVRYAIQYSNLDILKYLIDEKNLPIYTNDIEEAFRKDNLDILKYLIDEKNNPIPYNAVNLAAMNGNLNTLKYLIDEKNKNITSKDIKAASLAGELDVLKYFFDEKSFMLEPKDFPFTINNAETQIVKDYLMQKQKEQNK